MQSNLPLERNVMINNKILFQFLLIFSLCVNSLCSAMEEEPDLSSNSSPKEEKGKGEDSLVSDWQPTKKRKETPTASVLQLSKPLSKKPRLSLDIKQSSSQVYAIPTYDATFKYLMSDPEICISFLRAFVPDENIIAIKALDVHLRPFKEYQKARTFVNHDNSKKVVKKVKELLEEKEVADERFFISFKNKHTGDENEISGSGEFIKGLAGIYGDILRGYPLPQRNSQVDLLCEVDKNYYALVEVQVVPQDYWDKRALAYAANIYGRQLSEGQEWDKIKKVICINLLGGGSHNTAWPEKTGFTKLTFKDQDNTEIEEGIEILQYPLFYEQIREQTEVAKRFSEEAKKEYLEWIEFFEHAHNKREAEVMKQVETKAVRKAYERIKSSLLPQEVKEAYLQQEEEIFAKYSQYTEYLKTQAEEKGRNREKIEIAKKLLLANLDIPVIASATELSIEQIISLKAELENKYQVDKKEKEEDSHYISETQAKQESIELAKKQGLVGPRSIPGYKLHDVEDKGNCFYDAIAHQMKLLKYSFLNDVPEGTLPRDSLRLVIQGKEFKDKEWIEDKQIDNFVKNFEDVILAIIDTRHPDNGFTYYYLGDDKEVITHSPTDTTPLPSREYTFFLAATGNHFLSVEEKL